VGFVVRMSVSDMFSGLASSTSSTNIQEAITLFSISGNIGCGKTFFLNEIRTILEEEHPHWLVKREDKEDSSEIPLVTIIEEDLSDWSFLLGKFYKEPMRYAFDFQFKVCLHYTKIYEYALKCNDATRKDGLRRVILVERSPHDVLNVFIKTNEKNMTPEEYRAHVLLHELFCKKEVWTRCCNIFFLDTPFKTCWDRKKQRGRFEESTMDIEYMKLLHKSYHEMMNRDLIITKSKINSLLVLDDNQDEEARRIVSMIQNHLN